VATGAGAGAESEGSSAGGGGERGEAERVVSQHARGTRMYGGAGMLRRSGRGGGGASTTIISRAQNDRELSAARRSPGHAGPDRGEAQLI
jgi:hypothetical protein